jgi:hypothetical protein
MKKSYYLLLWVLTFSFALSQNKVSPDVIKEELTFLTETYIAVHPNLVEEEQVLAFQTHAQKIIDEVTTEMTKAEVAVQAQRIVTWLGSAHDSVSFTEDTEYLPVSFYWASDGLVVFPDSLSDVQFPPASEVLAIGELEIATVEAKMRELISGNLYGVRQAAARVLAGKSVLEYLGVIQDNQVTLKVRTPEGQEQIIQAPLGSSIGAISWLGYLSILPNGTKPFAWEIDENQNTGLFRLRRCDYSEDYENAVQNFFEAVASNDVKTVVIDLRDNGGGTTEVINPFLLHSPLTKLKFVGHTQRISETGMKQANQFDPNLAAAFSEIKDQVIPDGDMYNVREPQLVEISSSMLRQPIFEGTIYILVNGGTLSSAIDFASIYSQDLRKKRKMT